MHQGGKSPLEGLWDWHYLHISKQKVIVSHVMCEILCNIRKPTHQPIIQHLPCFSLNKNRALHWHAQGLLPKLLRLQMQLLTRHDRIRVVLWVRACVILHNLLLNYYYDRKWNDVHDFNDSETNQDEM